MAQFVSVSRIEPPEVFAPRFSGGGPAAAGTGLAGKSLPLLVALVFVSVLMSLFSSQPHPDRVGWTFLKAGLIAGVKLSRDRHAEYGQRDQKGSAVSSTHTLLLALPQSDGQRRFYIRGFGGLRPGDATRP